MGGTSPHAQGKGLGKALAMRTVELARERGFHNLVLEAGHGAARHMWTAHCGGVIRAEIPLDVGENGFHGFRFQRGGALGKNPFSGVGASESVSLCEVVLHESVWDRAVFRPYFIVRMCWITIYYFIVGMCWKAIYPRLFERGSRG
jgi:hypothetical protein